MRPAACYLLGTKRNHVCVPVTLIDICGGQGVRPKAHMKWITLEQMRGGTYDPCLQITRFIMKVNSRNRSLPNTMGTPGMLCQSEIHTVVLKHRRLAQNCFVQEAGSLYRTLGLEA